MDSDFSLWQSLALAAIQGATEFLPVSSSGHLVLARGIFGWPDRGGLMFDTFLHGGSLAAILIYFWREWVAIFRAYLSKQARLETGNLKIGNRKSEISSAGGNSDSAYYRRLPWLLAIATVPVVIAGPVFRPLLENSEQIRNVSSTGLSMIMTAFVFLLAERRLAPGEKQIGPLNALFIGCMQIIALLPGASRSGWTTVGGIFCGQKRDYAVRFAFFMAMPAIAGAIILQGREIIRSPETGFDPFFILSGFVVSFATSLCAIHFCLKYFRAHSLRPFAVYLILVGFISIFLNQAFGRL